MGDTQEFHPERLKNLILYVAERSRDDPFFGAVKLNKILYYVDFRAYRELGYSITGAEYQKLPEGPAPRELLKTRRQLLTEGRIKLENHQVFNYVQQRIILVGPADDALAAFTPAEAAIIEDVLATVRGKSGTEVSEMSHREAGWKLATFYETIPYDTAWIPPKDTELDEESLAIARDALSESAPNRR